MDENPYKSPGVESKKRVRSHPARWNMLAAIIIGINVAALAILIGCLNSPGVFPQSVATQFAVVSSVCIILALMGFRYWFRRKKK